MKTIFLLFLCVFLVSVYGDPYTLNLREKRPKGTNYIPNSKCHLQWDILQDGNKLKPSDVSKNFEIFQLTITQPDGRTEILERIDSNIQNYVWEIPSVRKRTVYNVILDAAPTSPEGKQLTAVIQIYVQPQKKLSGPKDEKAAMRILMDWNGRRGFYLKSNPITALKRAQLACDFIRKNVDAEDYSDYLKTIEKAEQTQLAPLTVFCAIEKSRLFIGLWNAGVFEEWHPRRKMYYLQVNLPVDQANPYKVTVTKDNNQMYQTAHLHMGKSKCVIEELYKVARLKVKTTNLIVRVNLANRSSNKWRSSHSLKIYLQKPQTVWIQVKKGPKLRVHFNPKKSTLWTIERSENFFYLIYNGKKYYFKGNELDLISF